MSEYPRVFPPRGRNVHDPRQPVYPGVRVLLGAQGSPAKREFVPTRTSRRTLPRMAAAMKLRYVVITSVNRDELPDGGSQHWAETVRAVRQALPEAGWRC